ncbi:MAG: redoxin domain-containing protein [Actinomycetota bacterium]|nr:redoxin domain-containing protein [Actinomycetota bacterium]MDK1017018.1 redoxin domain-containing protein [Actinomycetota bacterium]MDK1026806.1 redoxin domain-containing protein [Actinomycetota bacterium]MDK1039114.1 redoxin domain-containing protein [Actinomycetota bacterium]MDK1097131.1 redoxin domain-containing protein [Actinomycetota bacterium]
MTEPHAKDRGSRMVWAVIAAGLAFFVLAVMFAGRFGTDPAISSSPLINKPAPDSQIALMDGSGSITMSDYAGDILVVNFWASWCLSCRLEHPALLQAAEAYADFGVTFIAINYQDNPGSAEAYLVELGRSAVTVYTVDENSRTAFEWGVLGLPETFFVDRDGIVVGKVSGPVSYGLLSQTIDRIILGQIIGDIETGDVENR